MLRFLTAGESHGQCLIAILEGMVSGLKLNAAAIDRELARRQEGYGRGGRMAIEKDKVRIVSGVRADETLGGPIGLLIDNKDFRIHELPVVKCPRPGHADLVGVLKYERSDIRDILERASARETAARVAVGAVCKIFLSEFDIDLVSHVVCLGGVEAKTDDLSFKEIKKRSEDSAVRCADAAASKKMIARIDQAQSAKDTVGGIFEVIVHGMPPGLGSFVQADRRLSAILVAALASIPSVKGVEIGLGFQEARISGRTAHDEIFYDKRKGFYRKTNRAGGLEGGMTNGEDIMLRVATKPISTLPRPLRSVHIDSKRPVVATIERSDTVVTPAVAFELAKSFLQKFGGDSLKESRRNYEEYLKQIRNF
jgi:chorismate synthase